MMHPDYPLPDVDDPVMRPFWDGAREGRLMLQRDRTSGRVHCESFRSPAAAGTG